MSELKKKRAAMKEYIKAHPTIMIVAQQPDEIEVMDSPEKLLRWEKLVASSVLKLPGNNYEDSTGGGQTATYSYVGDKPVAIDHDSDT
jgi:hypothetical protein